jgi:hypothetical protein
MIIDRITDFRVTHAQDVIKSTWGDRVSATAKRKNLVKFGRNDSVGTSKCTLWYTGQDELNETLVAANTNSIDSISSASGSDTMDVVVEGHTESGGNKTFVVQTVTLTGQTRAPLTTPLNRVTRVYVTGTTNNAGEIYVHQETSLSSGKPSDTTKIHLTVPQGGNQSQKCQTSLSSTDYWLVTGFSAGYVEKSGTNVAEVAIEARESNGVWRPLAAPISISTGLNSIFTFDPYLIITPNSDIRLSAIASTASQSIVGDIRGILAIVEQ